MDKNIFFYKKQIVITFAIFLIILSCFVAQKFYNQEMQHLGMVHIRGGEFLMGSDNRLANSNERPAHRVKISGFWMDKHDVTNEEFSAFVKRTGYVTTAEKKPDWETLKVQLGENVQKPSEAALVPGAMVFIGTNHPISRGDEITWWKFIAGANWRHPKGPKSNIIGKEKHPVVQVSYEDALAYAKWVKKRLPTEAEWEYAARGGLDEATYTWGNEFEPNGRKMANTFAGDTFPVVDEKYKQKIGTSAYDTYPPNGYGLYDMAGNVWQWVSDWYRVDAFSQFAGLQKVLINPTGPNDSYDSEDNYSISNAPKKVIRGGSFLCDKNFCTSYRPSARRGVDPYNAMSHIGFRLVLDN